VDENKGEVASGASQRRALGKRVAGKAAEYPPTGDLYGCETKGVAGKGICKSMKTKGKQIRGSKFEVGSSSCRTDRDLEGIPTRVGRDVHSLL